MAAVTFSEPGNWTSWPPHEHAAKAFHQLPVDDGGRVNARIGCSEWSTSIGTLPAAVPGSNGAAPASGMPVLDRFRLDGRTAFVTGASRGLGATSRYDAITARIPAGRWGEPEDLAGAVVSLASPASDYVHGYILAVDGGWLAR